MFWNRVHNDLQSHPRSLILAPIENAYRTSFWSTIVILVLSCRVSEILELLCAESHFFRIPGMLRIHGTRSFNVISTILRHIRHWISRKRLERLGFKGPPVGMTYGVSNGHVPDDVTWQPKVLWGSTVGYPSDSLASCCSGHHSV